jgi:hypothetical protein
MSISCACSGRHWKISSSGEIATKTNALVGQSTSVALDDLDLVAAKVRSHAMIACSLQAQAEMTHM